MRKWMLQTVIALAVAAAITGDAWACGRGRRGHRRHHRCHPSPVRVISTPATNQAPQKPVQNIDASQMVIGCGHCR